MSVGSDSAAPDSPSGVVLRRRRARLDLSETRGRFTEAWGDNYAVAVLSRGETDWGEVVATVRNWGSRVRWASGALEGPRSTVIFTGLSVRGTDVGAQGVFAYPGLRILIEDVSAEEAAERLAAGVAQPGHGDAEPLMFERPTSAHANWLTTEPSFDTGRLATPAWPEYLVAAPGRSGEMVYLPRHPLIAEGLPPFPDAITALSELVGDQGERSAGDVRGEVVIRLTDSVRLGDPSLDDDGVRIAVEGTLRPGISVHAGWRQAGEAWRGDRLEVHASGDCLLETLAPPDELLVVLVEGPGKLLDMRGWGPHRPTGPTGPPRAMSRQIERWSLQGEGPTLEFKERLGKPGGLNAELAETVAAFANGGGGTILIGVSDDCRIVGYSEPKVEEKVISIVRSLVQEYVDVTVQTVQMQDAGPVHVVTVPPGDPTLKPYRASDKVYVRAGSSDRVARTVEHRRLMAEPVVDATLRFLRDS